MDFILLTIGALLLVVLLFSELYKPARSYATGIKKRSYITNTLLFLFNNIVLYAFQLSVVFLLVSTYSKSWGLNNAPLWVQLILGILFLDLSIWLWHLLNHKYNFLWRFHKCHHSEKYLNVTSAIRFHIGELLLSVIFKSAVILLLGIPFWIFAIYESLITLFAMFHHANITLSNKMQKILNYVIVTPNMHRAHHSTLRSEHDSNYGVIFSWWDKLFSTYKGIIPDKIGLAGVEEKGFLKTLIYPISKR